MKLEKIDNNFYIISENLFNNIKFIEFKRDGVRQDNEEYFTKETTEITFSKLKNKILIENTNIDTIIITQLNKEIIELPIVIVIHMEEADADTELTNKLESLQNMLLPVSNGDSRESFELFEKMGSGLSRLLSTTPQQIPPQIPQSQPESSNVVFSIKKKA
jgi:hypothetical protein